MNMELMTMTAFARRLGIDIEDISPEDTVMSLVGDERYLFSHILLDLHEKLNLPTVAFEQGEEFNLFESISDVARFFSEKVCQMQ